MKPEELQAESDLRAILETQHGRRFLYRLLSLAGTYGATFAGEQTHQSAWLEGRRSVGLELLADITRVSPQNWVHMLMETFERQELERLAAEKKEQRDGG